MRYKPCFLRYLTVYKVQNVYKLRKKITCKLNILAITPGLTRNLFIARSYGKIDSFIKIKLDTMYVQMIYRTSTCIFHQLDKSFYNRSIILFLAICCISWFRHYHSWYKLLEIPRVLHIMHICQNYTILQDAKQIKFFLVKRYLCKISVFVQFR